MMEQKKSLKKYEIRSPTNEIEDNINFKFSKFDKHIKNHCLINNYKLNAGELKKNHSLGKT